MGKVEKARLLTELRIASPGYAFHVLVEHGRRIYGYAWGGPPTNRICIHSYEAIGSSGHWVFFHGDKHQLIKVLAQPVLQEHLRTALIELDTYDNDAAHEAGDAHDWNARRLRAILGAYGLKGDESPLVEAWTAVIRKALDELQAWQEREAL